MADAFVRLGIKTQGFRQGLRSVESDVERTRRKISDSVGSSVGGFLAPLAGAAALRTVVENLSDIQNLSERLGVSTTFLQEYRFAMLQNGVAAESSEQALQRFAVAVAEARTGTGEAVEAFKRLGIEFARADGSLKPLQDVLLEVATALLGVEDGTEKVGLAADIVGNRGVQALLQGLKSGAAGFEETAARARELGVVLEEDVVEAARNAGDQIDALQQRLLALVADRTIGVGTRLRGFFGDLTRGDATARDFVELLRELPGSGEAFGAAGGLFAALGNDLDAVLDRIVGKRKEEREETEGIAQETEKVVATYEDWSRAMKENDSFRRAIREAREGALRSLEFKELPLEKQLLELVAERKRLEAEGVGAEEKERETALKSIVDLQKRIVETESKITEAAGGLSVQERLRAVQAEYEARQQGLEGEVRLMDERLQMLRQELELADGILARREAEARLVEAEGERLGLLGRIEENIATVREQIANLPLEVIRVTGLEEIGGSLAGVNYAAPLVEIDEKQLDVLQEQLQVLIGIRGELEDQDPVVIGNQTLQGGF